MLLLLLGPRVFAVYETDRPCINPRSICCLLMPGSYRAVVPFFNCRWANNLPCSFLVRSPEQKHNIFSLCRPHFCGASLRGLCLSNNVFLNRCFAFRSVALPNGHIVPVTVPIKSYKVESKLFRLNHMTHCVPIHAVIGGKSLGNSLPRLTSLK